MNTRHKSACCIFQELTFNSAWQTKTITCWMRRKTSSVVTIIMHMEITLPTYSIPNLSIVSSQEKSRIKHNESLHWNLLEGWRIHCIFGAQIVSWFSLKKKISQTNKNKTETFLQFVIYEKLLSAYLLDYASLTQADILVSHLWQVAGSTSMSCF